MGEGRREGGRVEVGEVRREVCRDGGTEGVGEEDREEGRDG